ncbi:MAG: hypothetical protein V5A64_00450 [Candidatus Thermoplasmatota archaeon]
MKKTTLIAIICVLILTATSIPAYAVENETIDPTIKTNYINNSLNNDTTENKTKNLFFTVGPAHLFSKVKIQDAKLRKINRISRCLRRIRIAPLIPIAFLENATFTLTYRTPSILGSKFSYTTIYGSVNKSFTPDLGNITESINRSGNITFFINKPHSLQVENFTGLFIYRRTKILQFKPEFKLFKPARFSFIGIYENVKPV